jgi:hypothetical protein
MAQRPEINWCMRLRLSRPGNSEEMKSYFTGTADIHKKVKKSAACTRCTLRNPYTTLSAVAMWGRGGTGYAVAQKEA